MIVVLLAVAAPGLVQRVDAGPVLLGLYSDWGTIGEVDTWLAPTGKTFAIAGLFAIMETPGDVAGLLNIFWNDGYVPFVNLKTLYTTTQIANGQADGAIREWARQFAVWAGNGQRRAFLAPLQEMNGHWNVYYGPPATFKQAYQRIRQIFDQELFSHGASLLSASWVFAPNGWSEPGDEFENYYPGANIVDIVSINGYNFGSCPAGGVWDTFETALKPYLDRLLPMAPGKPLFIAETGTVDKGGDKNEWLHHVYTQAAAYPRLRGVLYLNASEVRDTLPGCPGPVGADYRLHVPGTSLWPGFWNTMAATPNYVSWAPNSPQMATIAFGRQAPQIFADVPTIHPLALEDGESDISSWIHALSAAGVTAGCATNPVRYCPNNSVTRAQMAMFLLKAKHGSNYQPPPATGIFLDVPADNFRPWIEQLAAEGITGGCGGGNFCPSNPVTRVQMALFLLKAKHGAAYQPPPATGIFLDVPADSFRPWVEQLAAEGITGGCGGGNFCPSNPVTRAQMAVFLVKAFSLPH